MNLNEAIQQIRDAATMEGVRVALANAIGVAGRFDMAGMRKVIEAASDRLYEIDNPGYARPTGKMPVLTGKD